MAQTNVIDLLAEVAQICRKAPTPTLIGAYVRAARQFCIGSRWLTVSIAGATIAPTYTTGTVTVTNGSANVTGVGTSWLTEAPAGSAFVSADGATYTVQSVTTNTALVLTANYAGSTLAGQVYTVTRQNQKYSLGSDTYAEIFGVAGITLYENADTPIFLTESTTGAWDPTEANDVPELYAYLPEAQVAVHPSPDAAYNMTITALITPKRGSTSIDSRLATRWEYALQDGALEYLLGLPDTPWFNLDAAANLYGPRFRRAISDAANIGALGFNAGNSPIRSTPLSF